MEVPLPEIIDRISILKLKIERGNHEAKRFFEKELEEYRKALKEFEEKGIKIKRDWGKRLYIINKFQWNLESEMNNARKEENLEKMGQIYIELQISNKKRVSVKNRIAEETGEGFKDIKVN